MEKRMTIFDIDEAILNLVDEETGEVVDIEALEALEMERDKKVSNIACWIKQLDAEAEAIKAEKKNGTLTEDDLKAAEKDVQDLTDKYCKTIDTMVADKEKEIMSI